MSLFRNVMFFRLEGAFPVTHAELSHQLDTHPLRPCSALTSETMGWVPPIDQSLQTVVSGDQYALIALGRETKVLPASCIREEVAKRAQAFQVQRGFKPSRKALRDMKDQVRDELLPRALVRRSVVRAVLALRDGWLAVDAASHSRAEMLTRYLADTLQTVQPVPVQSLRSPAATMTGWLLQQALPPWLEWGDSLRLVNRAAAPSAITYSRMSIEDMRVSSALSAGYQVQALGLTYKQALDIVVDDQQRIRRLSLLETQDQDSDLEADVILTGAALAELLQMLTDVFGTKWEG